MTEDEFLESVTGEMIYVHDILMSTVAPDDVCPDIYIQFKVVNPRAALRALGATYEDYDLPADFTTDLEEAIKHANGNFNDYGIAMVDWEISEEE